MGRRTTQDYYPGQRRFENLDRQQIREMVRATREAKIAADRAERTCQGCGSQPGRRFLLDGLCVRCHNQLEAGETAGQWLADNPLFLDTSTTGLDDADEIIEIAVLDLEGRVMLNTLIKPTIPIPAYRAKIHGLTNQDVANAPTFADLAPALRQWFKGRRVIAYNAAFEARILAQSARAHDLPALPLVTWACAMELYARYHGRWSKTCQSYKWQSLSDAAEQCGLTPSSTLHRAVGKAELTRDLLRFLAEGDSRCALLLQIVLNEQPKDAWGWD